MMKTLNDRTTVESAALAFWMVGNKTSGDAMACVMDMAADAAVRRC